MAAIKDSSKTVLVAAERSCTKCRRAKTDGNADFDWLELWGKTKEVGSGTLNNASEGMYSFEDKLEKCWGD